MLTKRFIEVTYDVSKIIRKYSKVIIFFKIIFRKWNSGLKVRMEVSSSLFIIIT